MEKTNKTATKIMITILAVLLLSSMVMLLNSNVAAQTDESSPYYSSKIDPGTGEPYGDIRQYNWPNNKIGWSGGNTPQNDKFAGGPAPDQYNELWTLTSREDIGTISAFDMLMDGKVFIRSTLDGVRYVCALDPLDGSLIYKTAEPNNANARPYPYDYDTLMYISTGGSWYVYDYETGTLQFTLVNVPGGNAIPEDQVIVSISRYGNNFTREMYAFNYANLTDGDTPNHLWTINAAEGQSSMVCYGNGQFYLGSWGDYSVYAINARTGKIAWRYNGTTNIRDGVFYQNKVILSGVGQRITVLDSVTGDIIWDYNAGPRSYYSNTGAAAYNMYYIHNMEVPIGSFAAHSMDNGEVVWSAVGYYQIGYFNPCCADGKVFMIQSDHTAVSTRTAAETPSNTFAVFDAFTGEVLWTLPFQITNPVVGLGAFWYYSGGKLYCIADGPAENWSEWRGGIAQPGGTRTNVPTTVNINQPKWEYKTNGAVSASPVVVDGKLYVGSQDGYIYCLNAQTGDEIWKYNTGYKVRSTLAVDGGKVFTGSDNGNFYALDANNGDVLWTNPVNARYLGALEFDISSQWQMRSSPLVSNGRVYAGALNGRVYCLNANTGVTVWTFTTDLPVMGSPAIYDGVIYISSTDNNLYALDADDGTLIWNCSGVGLPISFPGTYSYASCAGTPIVANGTIWIGSGSLSPRVYNVNMTDGTIMTYFAPGGSTAQVQTPVYFEYGGRGYIVTSGNMNLQVWDTSIVQSFGMAGAGTSAQTNAARVSQQWLGHGIYSSPVIVENPLGLRPLGPTVLRYDTTRLCYIGNEVGTEFVINMTTPDIEGKTLSAFAQPGLHPGTVAIYDGKVYDGQTDHTIRCYDDTVVQQIDIRALGDKGETMWNNETLIISGVLFHTQVNEISTASLREGTTKYPGLPLKDVTVTLVDPDNNEVNLDVTTDMTGHFTVSYSPTKVGNWAWLAWYQGEETPATVYSQAYGEQNFFEVTAPTGGEVTPPPPTGGLPIEYVYAAIAVIVIIIVAVGAYVLLRRRK